MATSPFLALADEQQSPFFVLANGQQSPSQTITPFYQLIPNAKAQLPTSSNILAGLADARTNGVADDRSWFQKLVDAFSNTNSQSGPDNPEPVWMSPYVTKEPANKAAKTDKQIADRNKVASATGQQQQQSAQQQAAQQQSANPLVDIIKGFSGQSKPGDIQSQQQTPEAPTETPTGWAALFADPRIQQALLGFGTALSNNASGGQAIAAGAGQAFQENVRRASIKAATEEKQYQRSQDEAKNKREDRKVLNDEEKTKIDKQRADSLAKLQQAQADAAASGIDVDKARIRALNAATSKVYKEMKNGKTGKDAVSAKDYAKMLTDLSYNLDDPIEARRQLNDALPEGARQYATFTEDARQQFLGELKKLDLTTADGKRQAASIANRYSLIYGNVSPE